MNSAAGIPGTPGLYIHYPVCKSKCRYCGFFSRAGTSEETRARLEDSIEQEIIRSSADWQSIDTVYIGGGTPSLMSGDGLYRLMDVIRQRFTLKNSTEVTLEANPGDISEKAIEIYRSCGINRISLGVQSLDNRMLQFLGRRHDAGQAEAAMAMLRQAAGESWNRSPGGASRLSAQGQPGSFSWSVDVIMGIPDQDPDEYMDGLSRILGYRPPHVSCYQLTIEPDTPLAAEVTSGRLRIVDPDTEAHVFSLTRQLLSDRHYIQYEISNYACGLNNIARHNTKYWLHVPYLGIGPSAHSFDGIRRWWNITDIEEYCRRIECEASAVDSMEIVDERTSAIEKIMLGIRTIYGCDRLLLETPETLSSDIQTLVDEGLLQRDSSRIYASPRGMAVADSIAEMLIRNRFCNDSG